MVYTLPNASVGLSDCISAGADPGGGPGGQDPTPPFGGPLNFIKRGKKTSRASAQKCHNLVLNSYPDPPLSENLYPPLISIVVSVLEIWTHLTTCSLWFPLTILIISNNMDGYGIWGGT